MTLSEEEAKTKWCPFARAYFPGGVVANRMSNYGDHEHLVRCLGSECMAWEWADLEWEYAHYENPLSRLYEDRPRPTEGDGWEPVYRTDLRRDPDDNRILREERWISGWRRAPAEVGRCGLTGRDQ